MMRVTTGDYTYDWIEDWATIPDTPSGRENGRTHATAVTRDGRVIVFCQANPAVLVFDADGGLLDSWGDDFLGAHGMTLVEEDGTEYLWLTDQNTSEVVKTTLDGKRLLTLAEPQHSVYGDKRYIPTWVAVNEARYGGNGDIWVTDGYGASLVHRYDKTGTYMETIDGTMGAGAFNCPHGITTVPRADGAELYVADRGNHRVQVFAMDGTFKRTFGADALTSPDVFAVQDGLLVIPELFGRVALADANDAIIGYLGENPGVRDIDGWPNLKKPTIQAGLFNSPHGVATDATGNIFITEWIIGGRIIKLARVHDA